MAAHLLAKGGGARWALALALALGLSLAGTAAAADDKKGGEQVRRLQQKLMALQREQGALAQGKAELDQQLKEQGDKLAQARHGADSAKAQKAALERALAAAEAEKTELAAKLAAAEQSAGENATLLAASNAALRATEAARMELEQTLAARSETLAACGTKNESLHRMGVQTLKQNQEKSCFGGAAQLEMVTRLKQVGAENMAEELREKMDAELLKPALERQQELRRQAELQRQEQERAVREKAELAKAEQEQLAKKKARQQNDLDKLSGTVMRWLENIEW